MKYYVGPITAHQLPLVRFWNKEQPLCCILPPAYDRKGKDLGYLDQRQNGFSSEVISDFSEHDDSSCYYVTAGNYSEGAKRLAISYYHTLKNANLHPILCMSAKDIKNQLSLSKMEKSQISPEAMLHATKFIEPKIPVIAVGSAAGLANRTEVVFSVGKQLEQDGYRIAYIVFDPMYSLLGASVFDMTYSDDLFSEEIALQFNAFVNMQIEKSKADLVLIEYPEPLLKFSDYYPNGMGLVPYFLSQAVKPDYLICCITMENACTELCDMLRNRLSAFGAPNITFHLSNYYINISATSLQNKMTGFYVPAAKRDELLRSIQYDCRTDIFDLCQAAQVAHMCSIL